MLYVQGEGREGGGGGGGEGGEWEGGERMIDPLSLVMAAPLLIL